MKKWVLLTFLIASQASVGCQVGNGGDPIRATFIKVGEAILEFLKETEQVAQVDEMALYLSLETYK